MIFRMERILRTTGKRSVTNKERGGEGNADSVTLSPIGVGMGGKGCVTREGFQTTRGGGEEFIKTPDRGNGRDKPGIHLVREERRKANLLFRNVKMRDVKTNLLTASVRGGAIQET